MLDCTVVVKCLVYNHEKFLRDCLDGFVRQKTSFKFTVLIHDDSSTDSSRSIIEEYVGKYPELIVPFFEEKNQYSQGANVLGQALRNMMDTTTSKYVALCEGDDYWIDQDKLQRQIDFLENNPEYSICFHKAIEHWEDNTKPDSNYCGLEGREYKHEEIFQALTIPTASAVFRREVYDSAYYKSVFSQINTFFRDNMVWYCCAKAGRLMCLDFFGSVYRRQNTGLAYAMSPLIHMRINYEYYRVMKPQDRDLAKKQILFDVPQLLLEYKNNPEIKREILIVGHKIGILSTLYACLVYYAKKVARFIVSEKYWIKLKTKL